MIPHGTPLAVVRVHKTTGAMTSYSGWPGALTPIAISAFGGVAYDPVRTRLWFVPMTGANNAIYMDVNTGVMGYCATAWPAGVGITSFKGTFVEGPNHLWLVPSQASKIVRVDMSDCSMTGYDPSGVTTLGTYGFGGAVFDGVRYGWFIPYTASHVVKLDTTDGSMTGFNTWPTSPIFVPGTYKFNGGASTVSPSGCHRTYWPRT
ncbi:MAG: hypothetical protein COB65_12340 [Thalassobium sp.]|nr:MAG: hypothetical protein COB65_12340 [Thalassobium sp.]